MIMVLGCVSDPSSSPSSTPASVNAALAENGCPNVDLNGNTSAQTNGYAHYHGVIYSAIDSVFPSEQDKIYVYVTVFFSAWFGNNQSGSYSLFDLNPGSAIESFQIQFARVFPYADSMLSCQYDLNGSLTQANDGCPQTFQITQTACPSGEIEVIGDFQAVYPVSQEAISSTQIIQIQTY